MCVGMKQIEVRVIIVQCLEQDFILDKHYNTVTLYVTLSPETGEGPLIKTIIHETAQVWRMRHLSPLRTFRPGS